MRDSLIIVLFFAVGILLSCFDLYPSGLEQFNLSFYALCFLMFCVGISIGHNPHILLSFRRLSPKFFLLPVSTILGTLVGSVAFEPVSCSRPRFERAFLCRSSNRRLTPTARNV